MTLKNKIPQSSIITLIFAYIGSSFFSFEPSFVLRQPLFYLLLLFLGFYIFRKQHIFKFIYQWISANPKIVIVTMSTIFSFWLFGANFQAQWGPIDDHEIMSYLGSDQKMSVGEIPQKLMESEVGKPGQSLRYRPSYYTLRLTETSLWGNNAHLWYGFRLLVLISGLSIGWYLFSLILGLIPAGLVMAFITTYQMWADMFARLGPSETYTVLAFPLFILVFYKLTELLLNRKKIQHRWLILWLISTTICVGAKENYALLLLPNLVLIGIAIWKKQLTLALSIYSTLILAFTLFVASAFGIALLKSGSDIYGHDATSGGRIAVLILGMKHIFSKQVILSGVVLTLYLVYQWIDKKRNTIIWKMSWLTQIAFISYEIIFLFHFVFYNSDWPNHSRYDFPGVLVIPLFYITWALFIKKILTEYKINQTVTQGLEYGILFSLICTTIMRGYIAQQVKIQNNAVGTQAFTQRVQEISMKAKADSKVPLVIESGAYSDYEIIFAYQRFLRAYGVTNPLFLRLHNYDGQAIAGMSPSLADELKTIQNNGSDLFEPLSDLPKNCYSIKLAPVETTCQSLN